VHIQQLKYNIHYLKIMTITIDLNLYQEYIKLLVSVGFLLWNINGYPKISLFLIKIHSLFLGWTRTGAFTNDLNNIQKPLIL